MKFKSIAMPTLSGIPNRALLECDLCVTIKVRVCLAQGDAMSIITISRELAALGDEIANELPRFTGFRLVDKHKIEERIKNYGLSDSYFEKFDERKPSLLASISQKRDEYFHFLKLALLDEAKDGKCIFMGRSAFTVFQGVPGVLPVFLMSSMDVRIARVRSYFRCDEKRAKQIIMHSDADRAGFHHYFFETEWKASENYYLTINTSHLSPLCCAQTINQLASNMFDKETEKQSEFKIAALTLAQLVINHILYEKKIGIHFLEANVTSEEGDAGAGASAKKVTLYGVASSVLMAEDALAAALEVAGVDKAASEIQIAHEFSVMP
jgi:cytidylate kinase